MLYMTRAFLVARLEVYCGNSDQDIPEDEEPADDNSGPSATLRNMKPCFLKRRRRILRGGDRPILHFDPDSSTASRAERLFGGYHPYQEERLSYDAETKHIEAPEGSSTQLVVSKSVPELSAMRRQGQCKVSTIRKTVSSERQVTRFFWPKCNKGSKRVYLCDKVRQGHYPNNDLTCYAIWYQLWHNGSERPLPRYGRGIQMRGPGKKRPGDDDEDEVDDNTAGAATAGVDTEGTTAAVAVDTAASDAEDNVAVEDSDAGTEDTVAEEQQNTQSADEVRVGDEEEGDVGSGDGNPENEATFFYSTQKGKN
ncbi:hypothetical protein PHMEG_00021139 [Phytophthora megakarya]|uniref:PiggyBac transposable element-derived protein domain-containing protein n=1 Tax=Phytophthora megakarya TaxID=4795 RepID=A0A225VPB3_9STRA|nr:hypothetical protein PHMEG_00021139 [Phytophthora megakarya]